jgi:hypothetical protein
MRGRRRRLTSESCGVRTMRRRRWMPFVRWGLDSPDEWWRTRYGEEWRTRCGELSNCSGRNEPLEYGEGGAPITCGGSVSFCASSADPADGESSGSFGEWKEGDMG